MQRLIRTYRFLNIISTDVALGAVVSSLFFSRIMNADVRPLAYAALGLTVWIVYTIDHLLDAKRLTVTASTQRHEFHQQNFNVMIALVVVAMIADGFAVLSIRRSLLAAGVLLSFIIVFYLLLQRYLSPFKEFFGGILYTAGVILPATLFGVEVNTRPHLLLIVHFSFVVWMNLFLFSLFDQVHDKSNNYVSFTTKMGEAKTKFVIVILFLFSILLWVYQLNNNEWYAASILLLMSVVLFIIFLKKESLASNELYRFLGDAVFLLPLVYIIGK